jgi:hypothetical protein
LSITASTPRSVPAGGAAAAHLVCARARFDAQRPAAAARVAEAQLVTRLEPLQPGARDGEARGRAAPETVL